MPGKERELIVLEDLKWSRYEDYRIENLKKYRVQVCVAEIRYDTALGKKHMYYAHAYKFPSGTIRISVKRYAKADIAQDALDCHADHKGWRLSGFNHRLPVIDTYDGSRDKKEIVQLYN